MHVISPWKMLDRLQICLVNPVVASWLLRTPPASVDAFLAAGHTIVQLPQVGQPDVARGPVPMEAKKHVPPGTAPSHAQRRHLGRPHGNRLPARCHACETAWNAAGWV